MACQKEHMSFKNIQFLDWIKEDWEESWLKNFFEETKFLFVIFEYKESKKENPNRELYFKGVKLWNMPLSIIDRELKEFYINVKDQLNKGVKIEAVKREEM